MNDTDAQDEDEDVLHAGECDNEDVVDEDTGPSNHDYGVTGQTYVLTLVDLKGERVYFVQAAIAWAHPDD